MSKVRQSNIELLRIVLMLMIILLHLIVHGCEINSISSGNYTQTEETPYYVLILSITMVSVNCFFFISGYYGMTFKINTLMSFVAQAVFYSVTIFIVFKYIFNGAGYFWNKSLLGSFFPISTSHWWFLNAYLGIYILSPVINKGIELLSKYQFALIIGIMLFLEISYPLTKYNFLAGWGDSFYSMLVIYLIARYCKMYKISLKRPMVLFIASTLCLSLLFYILLQHGYQEQAWRLFAYNSPFIIVGAIALFYFFLNMKIKVIPIINKTAILVFGVYLIHDSEGIRYFLHGLIQTHKHNCPNGLPWILVLLIFAAIIFIVCACIEKVRMIIFTPLVNKVSDRVLLYLEKKGINI